MLHLVLLYLLNFVHYPVFKTQELNIMYQTQAHSLLSGKQFGASVAQMRPLFGAQRLSKNSTS